MENTRTKQGETKTYPKTDVRYWREKLFTRTTDEFHARVSYAGRQERFPLKTANKEQAANKARDIYLSLHANGWEKTLVLFKPWTAEPAKPEGGATVGEFVKAVKAVAPIAPTTFLTYERKFRFLVSQVMGIKGTKARHDYVHKGFEKWRETINAVPLAKLTPELVSRWRVTYIAAHSQNPLAANSARQTAASILRNAKSLFSPKILKHLKGVDLPSPLPFDGVELGKKPRTRYQSKVNGALIVKLAHEELQADKPELFKIFLLAFGAGLRRGEIDRLTWRQFDWTKGTLNLEVTEYGDLKTEGSAEAIDLGDDLIAYFKAEQGKAKTALKAEQGKAQTPFVIASSVASTQPKHWNHYRCDHDFKELIAWLRSKGVDTRNPLHTLRKEFGSLINAQFGLYAASAALRHSNITLTREYYVDRKERIALNLSALTSPDESESKERVA